MVHQRSLVQLGITVCLIASASAAQAQNFSLERVDNRVQSSGTLAVTARATGPVFPGTDVSDAGSAPVLGETAVDTALVTTAALGNASARSEILVTADVITPRGGTSMAPQAEISLGADVQLNGGGSGGANGTWQVGNGNVVNGVLMATGDFQVLPADGAPEVTNGMLRGALDIIITLNPGGTYSYNGSTFRTQAGNSFIAGRRNGTNGWVLEGTITDETGGSANIQQFFGENINEIFELAEPTNVGNVRRVEATANMGGTADVGQGANTTIWSISLSGWFEVESVP